MKYKISSNHCLFILVMSLNECLCQSTWPTVNLLNNNQLKESVLNFCRDINISLRIMLFADFPFTPP